MLTHRNDERGPERHLLRQPMEMDMAGKHSPLYPWYIGVAVIVAFELVVGPLFFGPACRAPAIPQMLVLIVLPVVYLTLMFLAFRSQP
ncbi:MAG: hypothetical protein KGO51_12915 [Alphaproteobacteria bacterium]|nr:hypothetical protein [Alphaproteobacteria bacterium]